MRGIGLPVSAFFRTWLDFYQLQPHHLTPNAVVLLSAFVTLCEGYLGVLPTLELWGEFFQSKLGTRMQGVPAQTGAFITSRRSVADNPFPVITLIQSVKKWQKSYFYVRNIAPRGNYINLPAYVAGPPAGRRPQWSFRAVTLTPAGSAAVARVRELTQAEGLTGPDLLAAFVTRRVLPLQSRPHLICQMSGQLDPSRMCTKEMPREEVAYMVNYLANCKLTEEWQFGKEPYSRANPPPTVCLLVSFPLFLLCCRVPFSRL